MNGTLPTARDWMREARNLLHPDDDIFDAIERLHSARIAAAAVLEGGRVVGMFTEKDSLRAVSQMLYTETAEGATVGDHMSTDFPACEPSMDLFRVIEQFLGCNFPTLPVIEQGRLVGMIDRHAMLDCIESYRRRLEKVRAREERAAGHQADRPSSIGAFQEAVSRTSREQLVRLFSRRKN